MAVDAPEVLLELDSVGKTFSTSRTRHVHAIKDISLRLQQGEFLCIVGPSGCGKSTIIRLAAGLDTATSGSVRFQREPLIAPGRDRGVVFQSYNAFPWLTVRENIAFGLEHLPEPARNAKVDHWLKITGLEDFADSYPKVLSGGMRQRLALARTVVVEPKLLLLDEPFGALDEPVRRSMQSVLVQIVGQLRCGVIFVTHDIREAILLGDHVMLMGHRPGRVLEMFPVPEPKPRAGDFHVSATFARLYENILNRFPDAAATPAR
jgi:NitT/TauT family transport system ATP-binding protein